MLFPQLLSLTSPQSSRSHTCSSRSFLLQGSVWDLLPHLYFFLSRWTVWAISAQRPFPDASCTSFFLGIQALQVGKHAMGVFANPERSTLYLLRNCLLEWVLHWGVLYLTFHSLSNGSIHPSVKVVTAS